MLFTEQLIVMLFSQQKRNNDSMNHKIKLTIALWCIRDKEVCVKDAKNSSTGIAYPLSFSRSFCYRPPTREGNNLTRICLSTRGWGVSPSGLHRGGNYPIQPNGGRYPREPPVGQDGGTPCPEMRGPHQAKWGTPPYRAEWSILPLSG